MGLMAEEGKSRVLEASCLPTLELRWDAQNLLISLPALWKGHLKDLRQVLGDQNHIGVLTFFRGKPDHPRKVKSYCRPELGGLGNVTELLHREARLLW